MKNNPKVSVIIPVYNDAGGLKDTLQSLVIQDFPEENFEIIVADNGSTDNTLEIAKEFEKNHSNVIKVVTENNIQSSYAARNKGILVSQGEIISFLDADMKVGKDFLSSVVNLMKKRNIDYLGCNVEIFTIKQNIFSLYNKITGFPIKKYIEENHFAPTCCLSVKRELFDDIGLFDHRLISGGDLEFGNRVYRAEKYKIHYAEEIKLKHPARYSLKSLIIKKVRLGKGSYQLRFFYPSRFDIFSKKINSIKMIKKDNYQIGLLERFSFLLITFILKVAKSIGYFSQAIKKSPKS